MDRATRAAKIAEIWRQLCWLEGELGRNGGPFLAGERVTHADMTWWGAGQLAGSMRRFHDASRVAEWHHPFVSKVHYLHNSHGTMMFACLKFSLQLLRDGIRRAP